MNIISAINNPDVGLYVVETDEATTSSVDEMIRLIQDNANKIVKGRSSK